ncbi:MAG TPA: KamA family radical SAM protein [Syntrophales bacterium]|nr:KamA family radical SAM protein [Syntrophales bacterium]HOL58339.1 KamA family radical SAM protein [Syntrophales bacterium]HPO34508.1 KamA family radical SAM protein [Syntrophales bacterium]
MAIEADRRWGDWHWQWRNRITTPEALATLAAVPKATLKKWQAVARHYPLSVTPYFLSLASLKDPLDPIIRQFVPDIRELHVATGKPDPLDEEGHMPVLGLIQRYPDRCLILATTLCAVYCRHCNRKRRWAKPEAVNVAPYFSSIVGYIKETPKIREVILSGGDPLVLPDEVLADMLRQLRAIKHVEVIRIGTRMPVVMPMRITEKLVRLLRGFRPLWVNTQFNHPREITPWSALACDRLVSAGIPVSNQSVLLKGINDDFSTMQALLTGLERISVRPYYLFQCDPVSGTEHFHVAVTRGKEIMKRIWASTSGLCLPRYVVDRPDTPGKWPLDG